ncbi:MbtH family protein [Streptomyces sp. NPDC055056]
MGNPFDDESARFVVLVNDEKQYSIWPAHLDVPGGWEVALAEAPRQECLDYVEAAWSDMRPASLVRAMEAEAG